MFVPFSLRNILIISVLLTLASFYIFSINFKNKNEFEKIEGSIVYLGDKYQDLPKRHIGKYRFIVIDGIEYLCQVFVGKDLMDFSPKYEIIDSLIIGEKVKIYYEPSDKILATRLINTVQFIERGNELVFIRGNKNKILGSILAFISIMLGVVSYILYKKGKIPKY